VSKIKYYSRYRDSGTGEDTENRYETIIEYDFEGRPIHKEISFTYKDGYLESTYGYTFENIFYKDTAIYDNSMNNIIMHIYENPEYNMIGQPIPGTKRIDTVFFEYDNNPKPNYGIDALFYYDPFPYIEGGELQRMFSKNNMTDATKSGYSWEYTYNENGLPITKETKWIGIETLYPMLWRITYKNATSIKETAITNLQLSPNPTEATSTLMLDLETAGNLHIILSNTLGQDLFEIHNNFETEGTFSKTFSIETLPTGVYFIKINHNGNFKIEKVIRK
jgi:hypothetical protein